ncbi:hypothetical protein G7Y89_g15327 [Cudoniella acicularis]|uniref:Enoyl reductase (ER) domain-containing protein n=1 Tax=Cudoniella acicularis TaxID=354080 RepID=A0A8H4QPH8_9HELO|nr:hypothetical protein G7Y89_g15327 [Cudoniella acicularis]
MGPPQLQTAIVQTQEPSLPTSSLRLTVSHSVPIPALPSLNHVLVRVLAVALNPTDFKMVTYFPQPGTNVPIGCDFCGVVEEAGSEATLTSFPRGTRVCGGLFPYGRTERKEDAISGAFAQWVAADVSQLLRVPPTLNDLQGAAIGGICWGTCVLALFADPEALALQGRPSRPDEKNIPVVVYGGATATGTMACQLLMLSGYSPIAVTSAGSAPLAQVYGATRRAIRTKEVMGFEGFGHRVVLGENTYSRDANVELYNRGNEWANEMQTSLDQGSIKPHPVREVEGQWQGIIEGLGMLQRGEVRGQKLVIRVAVFHIPARKGQRVTDAVARNCVALQGGITRSVAPAVLDLERDALRATTAPWAGMPKLYHNDFPYPYRQC